LSGKRQLASVSLFEVARRVAANRKLSKDGAATVPLIDRSAPSPVSKFVMSIANGDTVEYTGEKGFGPGYYRVGTIAVGDSFEISLFPATVARSEPKSDGSVRIRTTPELRNVAGRVILNVFGEEIFREPSTGD
jgi:hypothetical protein